MGEARDRLKDFSFADELQHAGEEVRAELLEEWRRRWPGEVRALVSRELLDLYEEVDGDRLQRAISLVRHHLQGGS